MKEYPSIPYWIDVIKGKPCHAFYKYDGSNLRFEFSSKRGWYKFGTRRGLFDHTHDVFGEALTIWPDIGKDIEKIIKKKYGCNQFTVFSEFFGENSFAGKHEIKDKKELKVFDIFLDNNEFISAREFVKYFGQNYCAQVIYQGNMNIPFIEDVKNNRLNLVEGVICKGVDWSCKIKTRQWLDKLKLKEPEHEECKINI